MELELLPASPIDFFASLVHSDQDFALFEAAVTLGQDEYPDLDVQSVLQEVDGLVARLRKRLPAGASAMQCLRAVNQFFFGEMGFGGNANHYYDPDNSFVHRLLRSRRGIPISLAVLWLELAESLGLTVHGVSFPGHFLVKAQLPLGQVVIDPMDGRSLSAEDLHERLHAFTQPGDLLDIMETPLGLYLQPATPREIIARMLRNLKEVYRHQQDWPRMLAVQERMVVLLPESWVEYRDRGLTHVALGHTDQALADLECYLVHAEEGADADLIAAHVDRLRRG